MKIALNKLKLAFTHFMDTICGVAKVKKFERLDAFYSDQWWAAYENNDFDECRRIVRKSEAMREDLLGS